MNNIQTIREFPTALITIKVKFGISLGPIEKHKFKSNQIVFQVLYIYGDDFFYKKVMKLLDNIILFVCLFVCVFT